MSRSCPWRRARVVCTRLLMGAAVAVWVAPVAAQPLQLVHVEPGRLTVAAHDVPLRPLLEEIARESGVAVDGVETLTGTVTVRFRRHTWERALPLLLGDRDYALSWSPRRLPDGGVTVTPTRLRIFESPPPAVPSRSRAARDAAPRPPAAAEPAEVIDVFMPGADPDAVRRAGRAALRDADRDVRSATVARLARMGGDVAVETLELALRDADTGIREEAVAAMQQIGGDRAARGLTAATHDRTVGIRLRAVDALSAIGGPVAAQLLEYVRAVDRDAAVRAAAGARLAGRGGGQSAPGGL